MRKKTTDLYRRTAKFVTFAAANGSVAQLSASGRMTTEQKVKIMAP
jgi:hypothetical protein